MKLSRHVLLFTVLTLAACKQTPESPVVATDTTSTTGTTATTATTAPTFPSIPAVQLSGTIPATVPIPSDAPQNATPEQFRPYFDWFSWESFIALSWPASTVGRGNPQDPSNPSTFTAMTNTTPVTWGTYKANWELYDQYDKRPTPWNDYAAPYVPSVCPEAKSSDKQMVMVTKGDTVLNDLNEAFSFPLFDQQSNPVYFEVRYNQAYYDFVRGTDNTPASWLYLAQNLPTDYTQVPLPPNPTSTADAIMIKAAWRNLEGMQTTLRDRYYQVTAWVYDPNSPPPQCTQQLMGLVGFHIAQKTKEFPQWIWSTFEQVDNVPPKVNNVPSSFNNGTDNPPTGTQGFANRPTYQAPGQLPPTSPPTQVVRVNPIPTTPAGASTVDVNNAFHAALPKNSPWQFYQLVVTQWPTNPQRFKPPANRGVYPQDAGSPFPVNGAVNTVLETYFQAEQLTTGAFGNSCMSCHYAAGTGLRDFSWGFARRPHQNAPPPANVKVKLSSAAASK